MKIVLISGGLNSVAKQFHGFPAQPVGIIELHSNDLETRLDSIVRKITALLRFRRFSNLEEYAVQHGLQYAAIFKRDVENLQQTLGAWDTNLVITSYCPMVPMETVENISHGAINLHPSLLPDYRGGNPLFWQVHDQVDQTGVTVHHLLQAVDSGPIIGQLAIKRPAFVSKQKLTEITEGELGTKLLRSVIQQIQNNDCKKLAQPKRSKTRYAGNFRLSSFTKHVDLSNVSLTALHDLACFYGEWPGEIGQYSGWRKFLKWVPNKATPQTPIPERLNGSLQLDPFSIKLLHEQGYVTLHPSFSIKHLIKAIAGLLKGR